MDKVKLYQQWQRAYRTVMFRTARYEDMLAIEIRWCTIMRAIWSEW